MRRLATVGGFFLAVALPGGPSAAAVPTLNWKHCGKHAQCAKAELPRDYSDPSKGTIRIALTRIPATDPAKRIGSLFFDNGGPGFGTVESLMGSGKDYKALKPPV